MEHERENFYRIITLILKLGTRCLRELLGHFLKTHSITLQYFLSQYQHELYHLYYNSVKCCRCTNNTYMSRKRILNLCQLEILFDVNTRPQGGQSRCNTSGFCCCQIVAKASLTTDNLDFTLTKCLLINCCEQLFVENLLHGQSFEDFLNKYKHDLYHAWQPHGKCCQCSSVVSYQLNITDKQWVNMYGATNPGDKCLICGCAGNVCYSSAIKGIVWSHLNSNTATTIIKHFCNLRKTLDELAEHRNTIYGHALDVKVADNLFEENWSKIRSCIMYLCAHCERNVKRSIEEEITFIKRGPLDERMHNQYHTYVLQEIKDNTDIKEEILFHLKETTEKISDNQIGVESSLDSLNKKLDSLLYIHSKGPVEITSKAIQTDHVDAETERDLFEEFHCKLRDKENELKSLDDRVNDILLYKSTYELKTSEVKQAIQNRSRTLQATIIAKEKELIEELDAKQREATEKLQTQMETIQVSKRTSEKKLMNYRKMIDTIKDDREMADQFIQDSMPTFKSMSTEIEVIFPIPQTFQCGKINTIDFGDLKEDIRVGSTGKEIPLYLDQLKIRRKFKVELTSDREDTSIYTVGIRPDGNIWLTTMNYTVMVANRQGRVLASERLKFTIFHTQCDKNGDLYCCAGSNGKIFTAYYDIIDKMSGNISLCEFENMNPFIVRGLHINSLNQLLVLLGHRTEIKSKVAIFSPERMIMKEVELDYNQLPIKEDLIFITQNSVGEIFLSGPQTLVRIDTESDTFTCYYPGGWEGKRIMVDQHDNIISSESRTEGNVKIHVTNRQGNIIKVFQIEGSTIYGINGLAIESQVDQPLLWITTTTGHVIAAEFLNTMD